jgi:ethanolamine ammonia-lyase small subunit
MTVPALWSDLRRHTGARVALGRVGNAVPTAAHLAFQADHAAARDAVHTPLDVAALQAALGLASQVVHSAAPDRARYLRRPDLGRRLATDTVIVPVPDCLAIVIGDGLSAIAAQSHAPGLIAALGHAGPVVIATQARVALGDDIGARLAARAVLVLIGERPGLSSADSLGAYLTWQPRIGRTDAERNCVSNIRPGGLGIAEAAFRIRWLIERMQMAGLTGVALKDESEGRGAALDRPSCVSTPLA